MRIPSQLTLFLSLLSACRSWSPSSSNGGGSGWTRRDAFANVAKAALLSSTTAASLSSIPSPAYAAAAAAAAMTDKKIGISNEELAQIITSDVRDNQFMVRADLTRSVYDESATFTDEIDTYQLDPWIRGTKRLFVADKSMVELVPDTLEVTDQEATFSFSEILTFNIPFLLPRCNLSGRVIMTRDPRTGLITSYREKWDQDVSTVLLNLKYGAK